MYIKTDHMTTIIHIIFITRYGFPYILKHYEIGSICVFYSSYTIPSRLRISFIAISTDVESDRMNLILFRHSLLAQEAPTWVNSDTWFVERTVESFGVSTSKVGMSLERKKATGSPIINAVSRKILSRSPLSQ